MTSSTRAAAVEVRPLRTEAEYRACVELQLETWGAQFNEVVPPILLKIGQRVGGVAAGAFESGELLGFVFGLTGVEHGRTVHWSHMLAVREGVRNAGIGQRLKEYQRAFLRPMGVEVISWTFDPLVARNAHLNLNRLGADVTEYAQDMYGDTDSPLHSGMGTDRFVVAWNIGDALGSCVAGRESVSDPPLEAAPVANVVLADERPVPVELPLKAVPAVRIEIPPDIQETKQASLEAAIAWRATTRRAFTWYLERGYRVARFHRDNVADRCFYVLSSHRSTNEIV